MGKAVLVTPFMRPDHAVPRLAKVNVLVIDNSRVWVVCVAIVH